MDIMKYLSCSEKSGSSLLIVAGSRYWNKHELKAIIRNAKDYYEHFFVENKCGLLCLEDLAEEIYEEEGIVLTIITKKEEKMRKYHFVCFLLEEWDEEVVRSYYFFQGYAIVENEENLKRLKKCDVLKKIHDLPNNIVYSGLVYQGKNGILPYQMAVNLLCQNPIISEKIGLSFVAIYSVECYNK